MRDCPKCLATNSYIEIFKNGYKLFVCEYCNSVLENTAIMEEDSTIIEADIAKENTSSVTELVFETEMEPIYYKKTSAGKILLAISFFIIFSVILVLLSDSVREEIFGSDERRPPQTITPDDDKKVDVITITPDEYKNLEKGMSIDEVITIVGGKAGYEYRNSNMITYIYDGENGVKIDATVRLDFFDGKLKYIYESGFLKK